MIVYVVMAKYIEYDSGDVWMVKGFSDRREAESLERLCEKERLRLMDLYYKNPYNRRESKEVSKYDKYCTLYYCGSIHYEVEELEVEGV